MRELVAERRAFAGWRGASRAAPPRSRRAAASARTPAPAGTPAGAGRGPACGKVALPLGRRRRARSPAPRSVVAERRAARRRRRRRCAPTATLAARAHRAAEAQPRGLASRRKASESRAKMMPKRRLATRRRARPRAPPPPPTPRRPRSGTHRRRARPRSSARRRGRRRTDGAGAQPAPAAGSSAAAMASTTAACRRAGSRGSAVALRAVQRPLTDSPARWMTAAAPDTSAGADAGATDSGRTSWPAASSAGRRCEPTNPVAPVMAIVPIPGSFARSARRPSRRWRVGRRHVVLQPPPAARCAISPPAPGQDQQQGETAEHDHRHRDLVGLLRADVVQRLADQAAVGGAGRDREDLVGGRAARSSCPRRWSSPWACPSPSSCRADCSRRPACRPSRRCSWRR